MTDRRDIFEEAHGKWTSLLPMFGVSPNYLTGKHGPCPMCGGKDRWRFTNHNDRGGWICNNCGSGNGMGLIMAMTGKSFRDVVGEVREKCSSAPVAKPRPRMSQEKARSLCLELWKESQAIRPGCEVDEYLASRGFEYPYSPQLRFHPEVPVKDHPRRRTLPAMLARVSDNSGLGVNIHRTYLENGRKARWEVDGIEQSPKKMMPGAITEDAAIRLWPHEGVLGVGEGIETSMAVWRDYQIPCWSLISSSHMQRWTPPENLKELHIFGDADPKFAGQAAAYALAKRLAMRKDNKTEIFVRLPDRIGEDFAD